MADVGRPKSIDNSVLQKLREGFMMGLTDEECCLYVGIVPSTLYNYCNDNLDFKEEKELLKKQPKIRAKMNLNVEINNGDKDTSKWYLERKSRDEFSLKQEVDLGNKDDKPLNIDLKSFSLEQLKELIKDEDKK